MLLNSLRGQTQPDSRERWNTSNGPQMYFLQSPVMKIDNAIRTQKLQLVYLSVKYTLDCDEFACLKAKEKKICSRCIHLPTAFLKEVLFCTKFIFIVIKWLNWTGEIISLRLIRNNSLLCYVSILKNQFGFKPFSRVAYKYYKWNV